MRIADMFIIIIIDIIIIFMIIIFIVYLQSISSTPNLEPALALVLHFVAFILELNLTHTAW